VLPARARCLATGITFNHRQGQALVMNSRLRNVIIGLGLALGFARLSLLFIGQDVHVSGVRELLVISGLFCFLPLLPYPVYAGLTNNANPSRILLMTGLVIVGLDSMGTYALFAGEAAMRAVGVIFIAFFSTVVILPAGLALDLLVAKLGKPGR
jgi:hypothetical protein